MNTKTVLFEIRQNLTREQVAEKLFVGISRWEFNS